MSLSCIILHCTMLCNITLLYTILYNFTIMYWCNHARNRDQMFSETCLSIHLMAIRLKHNFSAKTFRVLMTVYPVKRVDTPILNYTMLSSLFRSNLQQIAIAVRHHFYTKIRPPISVLLSLEVHFSFNSHVHFL